MIVHTKLGVKADKFDPLHTKIISRRSQSFV